MIRGKKSLSFWITVVALNLLPVTAAWAGLSKSDKKIIETTIAEIKEGKSAADLAKKFENVFGIINKECKISGSECSPDTFKDIKRALDALTLQGHELRAKTSDKGEQDRLDLLDVLKKNITEKNIKAKVRAQLDSLKDNIKAAIINDLKNVYPVASSSSKEAILQTVNRSFYKLVDWANENCKVNTTTQKCSTSDYTNLFNAIDNLQSFIRDQKIIDAKNDVGVLSLRTNLNGRDNGNILAKLKAANEAYSAERIKNVIAENPGKTDKPASENIYNRLLKINYWSERLCYSDSTDDKCNNDHFNTVIKPQLDKLVTEIESSSKKLDKSNYTGEIKELEIKIRNLTRDKKSKEEIAAVQTELNNLVKEEHAELNALRARIKAFNQANFLKAAIDHRKKREAGIAPAKASADKKAASSDKADDDAGLSELDKLRKKVKDLEDKKAHLGASMAPPPALGKGGKAKKHEDKEESESEETASNVHHDDLTPDDLKTYFLGFQTDDIDPASPKVRLLGRVPTVCKDDFTFKQIKIPSKIKGCEDSVGFQIIDEDKKGRACIENIWKKDDSQLCDKAHPCTDLSKLIGKTSFSMSTDKNFSARIFYRDSNEDEGSKKAMRCEEFPNSTPENSIFESAATKRAKEKAKADEANEIVKKDAMAKMKCQKTLNEIETIARPAYDLLGTLKGLSKAEQDEREKAGKDFDSKSLNFLFIEIAEGNASVERLVELREKLNAWVIDHESDKDKVNKGYLAIIQQFMKHGDFAEATTTVNDLPTGKSAKNSRTIERYKLEIKMAKVETNLQSGEYGSSSYMQINQLQQELQRNALASCRNQNAQQMEDCAQSMALLQKGQAMQVTMMHSGAGMNPMMHGGMMHGGMINNPYMMGGMGAMGMMGMGSPYMMGGMGGMGMGSPYMMGGMGAMGMMGMGSPYMMGGMGGMGMGGMGGMRYY